MTRAKKRKVADLRERLRKLWQTTTRVEEYGTFSIESPVYNREQIARATPADLEAMWAARPTASARRG